VLIDAALLEGEPVSEHRHVGFKFTRPASILVQQHIMALKSSAGAKSRNTPAETYLVLLKSNRPIPTMLFCPDAWHSLGYAAHPALGSVFRFPERRDCHQVCRLSTRSALAPAAISRSRLGTVRLSPRPSRLVCVALPWPARGSKSTNHDWNSAWAIASSVVFIRRFNSILSSSVPRMWAMTFCSSKEGRVKRNASILPGAV